VDYYHDEYRLTSNVTLSDAAGKSFSELPDDLKRQFLDYGLAFDVFVGATDDEVREVFRRMNAFTVPLNAEEQRHARYQGQFKWFMRRLSTDYGEAFRSAGVFNQRSLVRMQDQKLLTEICAAYFNGIETTRKTSLDAVYRRLDSKEQFPDEVRDDLDGRVRDALNVLFGWEELHETAIMRPYQVYALVLAIMHVKERVDALSEAYEVGDRSIADRETVLVGLSRLADAMGRGEQAPQELRRFVRASTERTNVASQRMVRFEWFCRALVGELPA
jgi:hypothetical protein